MSPADPTSRALEATLDRFAVLVRQAAARHRLHDADVDEVVQEVRIRLWKALENGETIAAIPASYVYRTAVSAALDLIRRRRARREDSVDLSRPSGEASVGANPGPGVAYEDAELANLVAQEVDHLIASRRPVVRMHLAGYKLPEIAAVLGWSEAKARNLVYRGLADLRERLSARGIGPETNA